MSRNAELEAGGGLRIVESDATPPGRPRSPRPLVRAMHVTGSTRKDVLHQDSAGGGAVTLPQLGPGRALLGGEEEGSVHIGEVARVRAAGSQGDVLHQDGT